MLIEGTGLSTKDANKLKGLVEENLTIDPSKYRTDRIENCLLLRRDVHACFDENDFGLFWDAEEKDVSGIVLEQKSDYELLPLSSIEL